MINFKPLINSYEYFQIVKPLGKSIQLRAGETVRAEVIDILPTGGVVLRMKGGVLTVETNIPLQKDTSLLLKILNTPTTDHKLKIQILGVLDSKGTLQILNLQDSAVQDLLQTFPQIKKDITQFVLHLMGEKALTQKENSMLANLLSSAVKTQSSRPFLQVFSSVFPHISVLKPEKFKELIANSGIFFENKIRKGQTDRLSEDLKGYLLSKLEDLKPEERQLLKTVENYQLLSKLAGGVFSFIPVFWEELERGDIFLKKSRKGKNVYFCRIDLDLKDTGKINAGLFMFGKDLYVNVYIENQALKELFQEDLKELTRQLKKHGFSEVSFKMLKEAPSDRKFIDEDFFRLKA
ncbi:flagellar hook-length control protein FliK [Persephonella sp.]